MNPAASRISASGWSRCGECPHWGSTSNRVCATRRAMPSDLLHCAVLVVFALHRQHRAADARRVALDRPWLERRIEPDVVPAPERASRRRRGSARACSSDPCSGTPRAPCGCFGGRTLRRMMCGAARSSATRSGRRAAYSNAIEPPSLWPNSHRRFVTPSASSSAGSTSSACWCMKSDGPSVRRTRAASSGRSRGANTPARAAPRLRRSAAGKSFHIASEPSPSCRNTISGASRSALRPKRFRCAARRPAQLDVDELRTCCARCATLSARAGGSAGSCRSPSSAARR